MHVSRRCRAASRTQSPAPLLHRIQSHPHGSLTGPLLACILVHNSARNGTTQTLRAASRWCSKCCRRLPSRQYVSNLLGCISHGCIPTPISTRRKLQIHSAGQQTVSIAAHCLFAEDRALGPAIMHDAPSTLLLGRDRRVGGRLRARGIAR